MREAPSPLPDYRLPTPRWVTRLYDIDAGTEASLDKVVFRKYRVPARLRGAPLTPDAPSRRQRGGSWYVHVGDAVVPETTALAVLRTGEWPPKAKAYGIDILNERQSKARDAARELIRRLIVSPPVRAENASIGGSAVHG